MNNVAGIPDQWRRNAPCRVDLARFFNCTDWKDIKPRLQAWEKFHTECAINWPDEQYFRIALSGFSTLQYIRDYLQASLLADGFVPALTIGGYNQLFQELMNPQSEVLDDDVDLLWIWADLFDLLSEFSKNDLSALCSEKGLEQTSQAIEHFIVALQQARKSFPGFILVNDFMPRRRSPWGIADFHCDVPYDSVFSYANEKLRQGLKHISNAALFPLSQKIKKIGLSNAFDYRMEYLADCPYTEEIFFETAKSVRPYVRAIKGVTKKVLVLDLDNTLWGGIVGEDGWDGVKIGDDPVGKAYLAFQRAILELNKRGIILAINSKNNPDDAKEVFLRRDEMVLGLEHFASLKMNWQDKATNCVEIAKEINVGIDSLVFWDDNPAERLLVKETLNDVTVLDVPSDVAEWAAILHELDLFDSLRINDEDARRGRMYVEDRLRKKALTEAVDLSSFLDSLKLEVFCQYACDENVPRIVSLLSRTNQFNLTTRRHSEDVIRRWSRDKNCKIIVFKAQDKFGSYGIVGVVILKITELIAEIDTLLLSCRAMGKGIEHAMIWKAVEDVQNEGVTVLKATYIPTKKNAPIKSFLPSCGFVKISENDSGTDYEYELSKKQIKKPDHVIFVEKINL